jgi:hypothetical protein
VIEAKIDHENGWVTSAEVLDLYGTEEPQKAFHRYVLLALCCAVLCSVFLCCCGDRAHGMLFFSSVLVV